MKPYLSKVVITALLLTLVVMQSCKKELPDIHQPENARINTYGEVFDAFWNAMNTKYQFWDRDTTNWDAMYTKYKPLFNKLNIANEDDQRKSVQYFHEMCDGLVDGHFFISFTRAPAIENEVIAPRDYQLTHDTAAFLASGRGVRPEAYYFYPYYDIDQSTYLDSGAQLASYTDPGFGTMDLLTGTINNNVLYLGFDACNFRGALNSPDSNGIKTAFAWFHNYLQHPPSSFKGVIIDLRSNSGGYVDDANTIAGLMTGKPQLLGAFRYKSGNGKLDYTPWADSYLYPAPDGKNLNVPIVVLVDIETFSAAEMTLIALKAIPGTKVVGERTYGGHNVPAIGSPYTPGGYFLVGNFLDIRMASNAYRDLNGKVTTDGLQVDYNIPFDTVSILAGRDRQLEKALSLLR